MCKMLFISRASRRPCSFFVLGLLWFPSVVSSGPPLVGDDPGTPGKGHLEVIAAIDGASRPSMDSAQAPLLDVAYGLSPNTEISLGMGRQQIKVNLNQI